MNRAKRLRRRVAGMPPVYRALQRHGDAATVELASDEVALSRDGALKPCLLVGTLFGLYLFKTRGSEVRLYRRWHIRDVTLDASGNQLHLTANEPSSDDDDDDDYDDDDDDRGDDDDGSGSDGSGIFSGLFGGKKRRPPRPRGASGHRLDERGTDWCDVMLEMPNRAAARAVVNRFDVIWQAAVDADDGQGGANSGVTAWEGDDGGGGAGGGDGDGDGGGSDDDDGRESPRPTGVAGRRRGKDAADEEEDDAAVVGVVRRVVFLLIRGGRRRRRPRVEAQGRPAHQGPRQRRRARLRPPRPRRRRRRGRLPSRRGWRGAGALGGGGGAA